MSKKVEFNVSEALVRSFIFEQSGSIIDAIKEGIQNILDAGASCADIVLTNTGFIISDNGVGMTKKEIDKYFKVFGESHKRGKSDMIGQYGLGRGQIFKCGAVSWRTKNYKMLVNAKKHLGYRLKKQKTSYNGTKISCWFYEELDQWAYDRTLSNLKEYIIPEGIKYTINGEDFKIDREVVDMYSDEDFEVFKCDKFTNRIFSQRLFVKKYDSLTQYNILCKKKMDLNIERSSFIEHDSESTKKLYALIRKMENEYCKTIKHPNAREGLKILTYIKEGKFDVKDYEKKKLVELGNGLMISLKELSNSSVVMRGDKDNLSDKAIQEGFTVVTGSFIGVLSTIKSQGKVSYRWSNKKPADVVSNGYKRNFGVKGLRKHGRKAIYFYFQTLEMNEFIFNDKRTIRLGESDDCLGWTDGDTNIWLDKGLFKNSDKYRGQLLANIYGILLHEYAHEEDDTNETSHDGNFYKRFYELQKFTIEKFTLFLRKIKLNYIKEKYEEEIEEAMRRD